MIEKNPPFQQDRSALPTIMVVTQNLKLLKLMDMALKLELACDVLGFVRASSAEETARSIKPDLVILDERFLDGDVYEISAQLHSLEGLSRVPTLFINGGDVAHIQMDHTIFLPYPWKVEALYRAVHQLLGHAS